MTSLYCSIIDEAHQLALIWFLKNQH